MIKIRVKRSIAVPSLKPNERTADLSIGDHIVDDSVLDHWFIKSMIKSGAVSVVNKAIVHKTEPDDVIAEPIKVETDEVILPYQKVRIEMTPTAEESNVGKVVLNNVEEKPKAKKISKRKKV